MIVVDALIDEWCDGPFVRSMDHSCGVRTNESRFSMTNDKGSIDKFPDSDVTK